MKLKMKYKVKLRRIIVVLIALLIVSLVIDITNNKTVQLTQLSPKGARQMMGYIIKSNASGKIIVVDGGTVDDTENLIKSINENGGKVDYWFLTHAHDDHSGAFTQIVNNTNIEIDNIYASLNNYEWYEQNEPARSGFTKQLIDILQNSRIKNNVIEPKLNDVITIDKNINAEILGVKNPEFTKNAGNEQSMVIKFKIKKTTLLILGDTGAQSSQKLLDSQQEKLKSDIVQMAHHGQAGATKELYEAINPKICLWPTPEWLWNNDAGEGYNTGNWLTIETRSWMEELGVKKDYVAKDGDITISI